MLYIEFFVTFVRAKLEHSFGKKKNYLIAQPLTFRLVFLGINLFCCKKNEKKVRL